MRTYFKPPVANTKNSEIYLFLFYRK